MTRIYLKQGIVPGSNNQEGYIFCDDPLCVNREGCLLAKGTKGTLRPRHYMVSEHIPKFIWKCHDYIAPESKIGDVIDPDVSHKPEIHHDNIDVSQAFNPENME